MTIRICTYFHWNGLRTCFLSGDKEKALRSGCNLRVNGWLRNDFRTSIVLLNWLSGPHSESEVALFFLLKKPFLPYLNSRLPLIIASLEILAFMNSFYALFELTGQDRNSRY